MLDQNLQNTIMNDRYAVKAVKEFYKERCQHQEKTEMQCENCKQSTFDYKKDVITATLESVFHRKLELQEKFEKRIVIMKDGEWHHCHDESLSNLGEDDIVVINWRDPSERYGVLRTLGLENVSTMDEIRTRIINHQQ